MNSIRQAVIYFDPSVLTDIVTLGWRIPRDGADFIECIDGIPAGARYIRGFYDSERDLFGMIFEHESFAEKEEGDPLTIIKPALHIVYSDRERL